MTAAPKRALVLGGGGVLGFAWSVGALRAWQEHTGADAADSALLVGTSAGSVLAALLACGVGLEVVERHHQGVPAPADPSIDWDYEDNSAPHPPRPGWLPGSPRLLLDAVRRPGSVPAAVALSGLLPRGRASLQPIQDMIAAAALAALSGRNWPSHPPVWIVATDYDSGRRVVFGRDDLPAVLASAVAASCAIPAWYPPVDIAGRAYIDGGTVSNASADAVLPLVVDGTIGEVLVVAPMAAREYDRPNSPVARLERVVRRAITRGVDADVRALRAAGAQVQVLAPGAADLTVMGANLMNPKGRTAVLRTALASTAELLAVAEVEEGTGA